MSTKMTMRDMLADIQTHRQTDREADRNTPLPYRDGVKMAVAELNSASTRQTTQRFNSFHIMSQN